VTEDPDGSFDAWYRSQWGRLVGALTVTTGDRTVAEDLAADAFAKALGRWEMLIRRGEPTAWLYTVALNDHKKRWRRLITERRALVVVAGGEVSSHEFSLTRPDLWDAVRRLPDRARLAVALRYVADLTEREVSDVMGVSRGTVASTLSDARRRLAKDLGDRGGVGDRQPPSDRSSLGDPLTEGCEVTS
jgi:RNA polymerase sigma-70 factor (ECF subfamily)